MKLLYEPSAIRTSNMLPDRSEDIVFTEPTLTQQQFLDECDINNIVRNNAEGGLITHLAKAQPIWGDFGDATDYQFHQNYIAEANSAFFALPAETRARFKNNPAEFLDFVNNPANQEEAYSLGLAIRPPEPVLDEEPEFIPNPAKKTTKTPPKESEE